MRVDHLVLQHLEELEDGALARGGGSSEARFEIGEDQAVRIWTGMVAGGAAERCRVGIHQGYGPGRWSG